MDSSIQILENRCQLCKKLSDYLFTINDTCVISKMINKIYIPKTILRGSKLCKKCQKVVQSKIRSKRYVKCLKCKCYYEYLDIYEYQIVQSICPICKFQFKHCWIHESKPSLFRQNERRLPCYKCAKSVILRNIIKSLALFIISPVLICFEGIEGVDEWPCLLQALFFLPLPITIPITILIIIFSKLLNIFFSISCFIQFIWSKQQQQKQWFV
ncbi:unnamed protein product [Paramecium sonneborni]|uniref:Transmembrane protein n=1 Tax=Paramecium sonneborni TaxID=65129 RepID=A0A8S1QTR3_9CILI|nr:unnamed protein product [Paramecium sonneborni]